MRPLFAIAPLALLLAFVGPRPVRWDAGEQARLRAGRVPVVSTAPAPGDGLATGTERMATAPHALGRGHLGVGLNTLAVEAPSPQGRPR
ncbi:hypothetical protein [uncultured Aquabacterium sp.]|uniref:hypothetical protein n=1 Tax=Aquabacterium commune TaxID=70586 RepID=UPI0030CE88F6|tara:strand:- start:417 stop:683 length:267 start_codon:yes stop_codon:yes gene_type:complete